MRINNFKKLNTFERNFLHNGKWGLGFEIEYTLNCVASVKMYGNVTVQANKQNDKTINNFAACFQEYYYR